MGVSYLAGTFWILVWGGVGCLHWHPPPSGHHWERVGLPEGSSSTWQVLRSFFLWNHCVPGDPTQPPERPADPALPAVCRAVMATPCRTHVTWRLVLLGGSVIAPTCQVCSFFSLGKQRVRREELRERSFVLQTVPPEGHSRLPVGAPHAGWWPPQAWSPICPARPVTPRHLPLQRYQDSPGVEHIPVVQIDLSVPLKVPGKCQCRQPGDSRRHGDRVARLAGHQEPSSQRSFRKPLSTSGRPEGRCPQGASPWSADGRGLCPGAGGAEPRRAPAGLPTSEQYVKLEEQRRHRQRLEKERRRQRRKGAKGKPRRHGSLHTESDEDIAPAQQVDIVTEEMPEVRAPGTGCRRLCPARGAGAGWAECLSSCASTFSWPVLARPGLAAPSEHLAVHLDWVSAGLELGSARAWVTWTPSLCLSSERSAQ